MPAHYYNVALPLVAPSYADYLETTAIQPRSPFLTLTLDDPRPIVDDIYQMERGLYERNIDLAAVLVGTIEYFTLRAYIEDQMVGWRGFRGDEDGMMIGDVKIILDPCRDRGPRIPIFKYEDAMKVYSARRPA